LDCVNGLIIDLSNHIGGSTQNLSNFISSFFTGKKVIRYNQDKLGRGHGDFGNKISITMQGKGYVADNVPLIILTKISTFSAGNMAAYILADLRKCTVIGTATSGGGGPPRVIILPNGWQLSFPYAKCFSPSGRNMEYPFEPDIYVESEKYKDLRDSILVTALEYLDNLQTLKQ